MPSRTHPERYWRPDDPGPETLSGVDAVIHLAGASIAGRFTDARKQQIRDSRIGPTRKLAELAADTNPGLRAFVAASAIGFYGPDRGDEVLTETSARGDGFLADVVAGWEDAATPAAQAGIRTVQVRLLRDDRGGRRALLGRLLRRARCAPGPGGRIGLQTIAIPHDRLLATRHTYTWIQKYIFPGGLLPSLTAIENSLASGTRLRITGREDFGLPYAETLKIWRDRFGARAGEAARLGFDEVFPRMWSFYLAYSEAGFRSGYIGVSQLTLARR